MHDIHHYFNKLQNTRFSFYPNHQQPPSKIKVPKAAESNLVLISLGILAYTFSL